MFPGTEVKEAGAIPMQIAERLGLRTMKPLEAMASWRRVGIDDDCKYLQSDWYYVFHEHPVHPFKNKLFLAHRNEVCEFVRANFDSQKMEGVDVVLCSTDFHQALVCNHDGDIFAA